MVFFSNSNGESVAMVTWVYLYKCVWGMISQNDLLGVWGLAVVVF